MVRYFNGRVAPATAVAFFSLILLGFSGTARSFNFDLGEISGSLDNQISLGTTWRLEDRDERLIGKSNLNPGLCLRDSGNDNDPATTAGDGCNSTSDPSLNDAFVAEPGSFSPNGDNGNLNYDKGDLVGGGAKVTSDLSAGWRNFNFLLRGTYFFDDVNTDFRETHPDTTFQPRRTDRPNSVEDLVGNQLTRLDTYIEGSFTVADRFVSVRVGDQVLNWGESAFLLPNSINSINPPHLPRLRSTGFDVKELLIPTGMVSLSTNLTEFLGAELFYQYDWQPVVPDPVGSFYSTSDIAGEGGTYAMLSFSKAPEDPTQSYDPKTNPDDATGLFSSSSRTILRAADRTPKDGGQYGARLSYFAQNLNGGTDFSFYYMNYHSRFPLASFTAADDTCLSDPTLGLDLATFVPVLNAAGCGVGGDKGQLGLQQEPLPVETARVFLEYPEDIELLGFSFNTLIGGVAWSGEIAYRDNQPLQIHTTDLTLAALQPAFPEQDVPVCLANPLDGGCVGPVVAVVPGRRSAVPDFVETRFRGNQVQAGDYIRGFESMEVANFGTTFLNTIGGSNLFNANQIVLLLEVGGTYVFDMPDLDELQFNAAGTDTHISPGADGTTGVGGSELGPGCLSQGEDARACRQNPTAEDRENFPDDFSWGFRSIALLSYQDLFWGVNVEPLFGWFHDVDGIAPGPGGNFIEGRSTVLLGLRWDYLDTWSGEFRWTVEEGAGANNDRLDRDTLSVVARYEF